MTSKVQHKALVHSFLNAYKQGKICVHPTDTLWGLTYNYHNLSLHKRFCEIRGINLDKPHIGLVCSLDQAKKYWVDLPLDWSEKLQNIWPGPLTVIWKARSPHWPQALLNSRGELALRVPLLESQHTWFYEVIKEWGQPILSTSINKAGLPPACHLGELQKQFPNWNEDFYWPEYFKHDESCVALPSTVIRLFDDGSFEILRQGAYRVEALG